MPPNQVPAFNSGGILPPSVAEVTSRAECSPYDVTMDYVIDRFGTNPVRLALIRGLVNYRKALYDGGFRVGYQWVNGSFVENSEQTRGRSPSDIDVVTLFHRPVRYQTNSALWKTESTTIFGAYFHRQNCLTTYKCDSFPIDLDKSPLNIVADVTYWFSLFSHQKVTNVWKGMLRIKLIDSDPEHTNELLLLSQAEARTHA